MQAPRAATRRGWEGGADRVRDALRMPLVRNAYSLVGATLATSGLGVVFWIVAARSYSTAEVGIDAALISAMVFLSRLAQLNLASGFNRFVPTAGAATRRFVLLGYAASVSLAAVAATVFVAGVRVWTPKLSLLGTQHARAAWFVTATIVWTLFVLQDSVLTGLGEAPWVLFENAAYGILKLLALVAIAVWVPGAGVFVAWTIPLVVLVVPVSRLLFRRLIPARVALPREAITARSVGQYVSVDFAASILTGATSGLLPLLVLARLGARASAYVYMAWSIAYTVHFLSENVGMSLITEGSRDPEHLIDYARTSLTHALRIVVPLAAAIAVAAPLILRVFGRDYSAHAAGVLRLLTLSAIPNAVVMTYLSVARVRRRMGVIFVIAAAQFASILVLALVLLPVLGLEGVGLAWLLSLGTIALILLAGDFRTVWLPYVRPAALPATASRGREVLRRRSERAASRCVGEVMRESGLRARGWEAAGDTVAASDVCTLALESRSGAGPAMLKVATNDAGHAALAKRNAALRAIRSVSPLGWDASVPEPVDADLGAGWTLESRIAGIDARGLVDDPDRLARVLEDLGAHMESLYSATSGCVLVDDRWMARLVDEPLRATQVRAPSAMPRGDRCEERRPPRAMLGSELAGRTLTTGFVHGNLWLGNVLWLPKTGAVNGIVGWMCEAPGIPVVDLVHLACSTLALEQHREIGAVVCELLERGEWPAREARLLACAPAAAELSTRAALLLAWLQHVGAKGSAAFANDVWMTHNVHQVLEHV